MLYLRKVYLLMILLGVPTIASAQICGTLAHAADHLAAHRDVFEGAEWAATRSSLGIQAISPNDSVELVTSSSTCSSLTAKEVSVLGLPGNPNSDSYAIYRYGNYYAIEYRSVPRQPADTIVYHGSARLRVYTVEQGQRLKGTINVEN